MFFMMGITDEQKEMDFSRMVVCDACGAYGCYRAFMTCTLLSLFFIPCFRWNRRYFVQASCCGAVFEIDKETGARIARGEDVELKPENLRRCGSGGRSLRRCGNCGYSTSEDFDFCPRCGRKF